MQSIQKLAEKKATAEKRRAIRATKRSRPLVIDDPEI
jgi:hypothetical protein